MGATWLVRVCATPAFFLLAGLTLSVDVALAQPVRRAIPYDLNGDGRGDLVWRNRNTGQDGVWFMNGSRLDSWALTITVPDLHGQWTILASDDFDGDGKADLLWQHTLGYNAVWLMDGDQVRTIAHLPATPLVQHVCPLGFRFLGSKFVGTGDFDGDGRSDILWQSRIQTLQFCSMGGTVLDSGNTEVWLMNGTTVRSTRSLPPGPYNGISSTVLTVGDANGDGISDLFWQDGRELWLLASDGTPSVVQMPRASSSTVFWNLRAVTDLDGDGRADAVWQTTVDGLTYTAIWLLNGGTVVGSSVLPAVPRDAWKLSTIVDTDGDGRSDFFWRASTGHVFRWRMDGLTIQSAEFLTPARAPVEWELE